MLNIMPMTTAIMSQFVHDFVILATFAGSMGEYTVIIFEKISNRQIFMVTPF